MSSLCGQNRPSSSAGVMLCRSRHGWPTMTSTLLCCQPVLLLLLVLLSPGSQAAAQGGDLSPAQVLQDLLARYGDNSTISVPQLRSLLAALSLGQREGVDEAEVTEATPPRGNGSKVQDERNTKVPNFWVYTFIVLCFSLKSCALVCLSVQPKNISRNIQKLYSYNTLLSNLY